MSQVKKKIIGHEGHYELAKGTPRENFVYCTKEESRAEEAPHSFGEFHEPDQGRRTDLKELVTDIRAGKSFNELVDGPHINTLARHMRFYETAKRELIKATPRPDIHVTFCFGRAGTGKSTCAGCGDDPDATFLYDGGFWEGYTGQEKVIFDEMGGHICTPLTFNRVCDRYPYTVNIKGSSAPLKATDIRITSNNLPSTWWGEHTKYNREALSRRIHECHYHYELEGVKEFYSDEEGYALDKMIAYLNQVDFNHNM